MRLTPLGIWSPYPRAGGASPSYLVEAGETRVLLDCGNGSLGKLLEVCDFRKLSAVAVTHYHPDHYYDLFSLRHAIAGSQRDGARTGPLTLYLPAKPESQFKALTKFEGVFRLQVIEELSQGNGGIYQSQAGAFSLEFCPTNHSLRAYAVAVNHGPVRLVYSGDTAWSEEVTSFARGADLFLCEASLQEQDKEHTKVGHLTARQAGEMAREAGVKKLLLTHFWPEYDLSVTLHEARQVFGHVELAQEGRSYLIE